MNSLSININLALKPFTLAIDQTLPLSGITAIFGYSGAGKTSLLRTIAGLEKSAVGKITYQQEVWLNSADKINIIPNKRHVGFVFQDNRLFPHLTVLENLQYAIKRKKQTNIAYKTIAGLTNIEALLSQYPDSLSGGEQQRVAIARAILNEPKLLLLDEPFSALDIRNKANLISLLHEINQQYQIPMLYVSHSLDDIQQLADNMLVIEHGKVSLFGNTADVIHQLNYRNIIRQQTSLALPINQPLTEQISQYGLMAVSLNNQDIYLTKPNFRLDNNALLHCFIAANDISISLTHVKNSSIVNNLLGKIKQITIQENQALIKIHCFEQVFFAMISLYSLENLALVIEQQVYLQFKASSIKTLKDSQA